MRDVMRRLLCTLTGGHDSTLQFEPPRMFLKCQTCPFESSGWTVEDRSAYRSVTSLSDAITFEQNVRRG